MYDAGEGGGGSVFDAVCICTSIIQELSYITPEKGKGIHCRPYSLPTHKQKKMCKKKMPTHNRNTSKHSESHFIDCMSGCACVCVGCWCGCACLWRVICKLANGEWVHFFEFVPILSVQKP